MNIPLLTTKLYMPPPRPDLVSRPRLVAQLNAGLVGKLTLISAPAGYGKTTLLSTWLSQLNRPAAWLSLDEADNDTSRFCDYLIAALQTIAPRLGERIPPLPDPSGSVPIHALMTSLMNEILNLQERILLVLDDYHVILADEIHQLLVFLLENLPANLHLIVSTRTDPPLQLARLRASASLSEIRADVLRFTRLEVVEFLNGLLGLGLHTKDIKALEEKTEGWIAGLQLAAISLRDHQDKEAFVRAFTGDDRYIADYLVDEALSRQLPHIQSFLLKTSILDQLCASLCDALTERNDSQSILMELERTNLFLVPMDNHRNWYRYHHLFAELLKIRLRQSMPEEMNNVYQRISNWYEKTDLLSQAAMYALKGGDIKRVSRLVAENSFALVDINELTALALQLDRIPESVFRSEPWLVLTKAWSLAFAGQFESAESLLEYIEMRVEKRDSADDLPILGRLTTLRAYIASGQGNKVDCIPLAQKGLEYLPEDDLAMRGFTLSLMGNAYRDLGDLKTAFELLDESVVLARKSNEVIISIIILCRLVSVQKLLGNLNQAQATCQEALDIADEYQRQTGRKLPATAIAKIRMGDILYAKNDLDVALQFVDDGLSLSKNWGHYDMLLFGYRVKSKILQAMGDIAGTLAVIETRARYIQGLKHETARYSVFEAEVRLLLGDITWVGNWVESVGLDVQDEFGFRDYHAYYVLLHFLVVQDHVKQSEFLLNRLLELVEQGGSVTRKIDLLILQAILYNKTDNIGKALDVLGQALLLASPEGYSRVFLEQGESMMQLLYQVALQGICTEFCQSILEQFSPSSNYDKRSQADLVEPLSDREIDVLERIARGLTNQEIAGELVLSLYTVKSHAHNIYGKLGVKNRTEAVSRARMLGLLPQI